MSVRVAKGSTVTIVRLERQEVRNAVDGDHADALFEAFAAFEADDSQHVAVLYGAGGTFCSGADLTAVSNGTMPVYPPGEGRGPMGPTRMQLSKPVIAAVEGYAVAGGLELALWCDLRVVDPDASFGVYCRRWGVPLIDGGTVRLPRLIGQSRALDMILTGREVDAREALRMGLANRVSKSGKVLKEAVELAEQLAALPQVCLREDRASVYGQNSMTVDEAMAAEWRHGMRSLAAGTAEGAARFVAGEGRHGRKA